MRGLLLLLLAVVLCNGNLCDSKHGYGDGGDLWFYGFNGQSFPFVGHANGIYMIYSDPYVAINSRFEYAIPHQNDSSVFTIMADIGIKTNSVEMEIKRGSFHSESASVTVNSQKIKLAKNAKAHKIGGCAHVVYEHDNSIIVITPLHQIRVELKKSHSHHIKTEYLNIGLSEQFDAAFAYGGVLGQTYNDNASISIDDTEFVVKSLFSSSAKDSTFENKEFVCTGDDDVKVHPIEQFHMIHHEEKVQKCEDGHFCVSEDGKTFSCKPTGCGEDPKMTCAPGTTCLFGNCLRDDQQPCASDDQCYSGECSGEHTCGCLTADAMILLEDGVTEVRADSLKVGDRIYNYPQGAVTIEHIYIHPFTGMIFSLDDSTYFFTSDHPFPAGDNINKTLIGDIHQMFPKVITENFGNGLFKLFGSDPSEGGNFAQMENGNVLQYFNKATGSFEKKEIKNLKSIFVNEMDVYTFYFKEGDATYLSVANGYVNGFNFKSSVAHEAFKLNLEFKSILNNPMSTFTRLPQIIHNLYRYWISL